MKPIGHIKWKSLIFSAVMIKRIRSIERILRRLRMTGEKMKRNIIAIIMAGVLVLGLIGCGKETKDTGLNKAETEQSVSIEKAPKE